MYSEQHLFMCHVPFASGGPQFVHHCFKVIAFLLKYLY